MLTWLLNLLFLFSSAVRNKIFTFIPPTPKSKEWKLKQIFSLRKTLQFSPRYRHWMCDDVKVCHIFPDSVVKQFYKEVLWKATKKHLLFRIQAKHLASSMPCRYKTSTLNSEWGDSHGRSFCDVRNLPSIFTKEDYNNVFHLLLSPLLNIVKLLFGASIISYKVYTLQYRIEFYPASVWLQRNNPRA